MNRYIYSIIDKRLSVPQCFIQNECRRQKLLNTKVWSFWKGNPGKSLDFPFIKLGTGVSIKL